MFCLRKRIKSYRLRKPIKKRASFLWRMSWAIADPIIMVVLQPYIWRDAICAWIDVRK